MDSDTRRIVIRKVLFAFLWSIVFFILTSATCLIYFSSTAYDFADFAMMETVIDDNGQVRANQAAYRDTGAKVAYGLVTMYESDIFLGLIFFSIVVSAFGAYIGILPGTDEISIADMLKRAAQDNVSTFALSPQCPNCGADVQGKFCGNCGQAKNAAKELTLTNFTRQFIPEVLNIDRKFFRTLKHLLTQPGFLTLEYLQVRRERYTLPTQLYFVVAAIFFFVSTNLDLSTDILLQQPQFAEQFKEKAKTAQIPVELLQQRIDDTVQNYIPFYTFFIVLMFALFLKILYPNWYYVEHLIFTLHFITYFLILWMGLIIISSKIHWLEALGPILPLPYLYFSLRNVHFNRAMWKFVPAALMFLLLFVIYAFLSLALGFFLV